MNDVNPFFTEIESQFKSVIEDLRNSSDSVALCKAAGKLIATWDLLLKIQRGGEKSELKLYR